jgi:hypothetical protein
MDRTTGRRDPRRVPDRKVSEATDRAFERRLQLAMIVPVQAKSFGVTD